MLQISYDLLTGEKPKQLLNRHVKSSIYGSEQLQTSRKGPSQHPAELLKSFVVVSFIRVRTDIRSLRF